MSHKPKLLDLYCGAGGASMGYHQAGYAVTGVDINAQPRYPFPFIQADALEYLIQHGTDYDIIHASPPCQAHTKLRHRWGKQHRDYVPETRNQMRALGRPYVIENVPGAPLLQPLTLCGTMFGLDLIRHRLFECYPIVTFPPATCNHHKPTVKRGKIPHLATQFHSIYGHFAGVAQARQAMRIHWMTGPELAQAIPPAYTHWLGTYLINTPQHTQETYA